MTEPFFKADDPLGPPRLNGEFVFASPWESRVFGLAAALRERELFDWDEFRVRLIAEIAEWEQSGAPAATWNYYERFRAALEKLLEQKGWLGAAELEEREQVLASRPAGHDHSA